MDRHRNLAREQPIELADEREQSGDDGQLQSHPSSEDLLLNTELGQVLDRALAELPPALRHPAIMRLMNDESYASIAQSLRISQANARKRIQLARQMLQRRLRTYL